MNRLPPHRSAVTGRTFSRVWNPADYNPIQRTSRVDKWADGLLVAICLAVFAGIAGGWI